MKLLVLFSYWFKNKSFNIRRTKHFLFLCKSIMGLAICRREGDWSTMFPTWLVCLKFSQRKSHLKLLHTECSFPRVYFELATSHYSQAMPLRATLSRWHGMRGEKKNFPQINTAKKVFSGASRIKMTDVARLAEAEEWGMRVGRLCLAE